ncbi:hypothetical protein [Paenibacillus methanolicus]|uniref:Uncharacterized protein n=1 Tax=Paenibacillus methanolicus TaxID=582686 RepID=A0A5S5C5K1_9BACL|nr:hypothetical protein [Paenibacillus methanolicus]TYP73888.1 hypothetical protein BCM02_106167 [Paenibacillus methanolicus]
MIDSLQVKGARVRGVIDRDGMRCALVEVDTEAYGAGGLLAYFGPSADEAFEMTAIVHNDASRDIDWFDNSSHLAYEDVSIGLFETASMTTDWGQREAFKEQVLSAEGVREGIARLYIG